MSLHFRDRFVTKTFQNFTNDRKIILVYIIKTYKVMMTEPTDLVSLCRDLISQLWFERSNRCAYALGAS